MPYNIQASRTIQRRPDDGKDGKDGHAPYIGANGNWWVWDSSAGKYIDSGDTAKGDDGRSPVISGGTWHVWQNGGWVDTGIKAEGKDAVNIIMSPTSHSFATTPNGNAKPRSVYLSIKAYRGETPISISASQISVSGFVPYGMSVTKGTNQVVLTVNSSFYPISEGLEIYVTINSVSYLLVFLWDSVKDGEDGHTPYIGANGNWWVWDSLQNKYVDSGDTAKGDDGRSPVISGGTWHVWQNGQWVDTGIKAEGKDGLPGIPGQVPFIKEWVVGDTHRNTDEIIDFIYVRGKDKQTSYYYKKTNKGTSEAAFPPSGGEARAGYERVDWLKELAVQVLIAEEANIANFIFKDEKLLSIRGKTFAGLEILYGEYTEYEFTNRIIQPSVDSSYWTSLPEGTTRFIRFKKHTENDWTVKEIGTYGDRWTVQYADNPESLSWYNSYDIGRNWMQIREAGDVDFKDAVKIDITDGYDFEPNIIIDGARGTMKITGEINATSGMIGGMSIAEEMLVSQNGKVVIDGISNQIYLKDEDSDEIRTILSPRKLPLTPSSYFGSSSPINVSLGSLQKSYIQNSSSVNLITIPSGDSSTYQITIPPITMNVNVDHPGDIGGSGQPSFPNIAEMRFEIYKGGILQYVVSTAVVMSTGGIDASTVISEVKSYTIQGSGTWSVRVTHVHRINYPPSSSSGSVMAINGNAIVAKVVNSSAIGSNGMIIATSGTEYTYMVEDIYEVRRGNVGFKITSEGIQKSTNMNASTPLWQNIEPN